MSRGVWRDGQRLSRQPKFDWFPCARPRMHAHSGAKRHIRKTILNINSCMDLNEIVLIKYVWKRFIHLSLFHAK